MNPPLSGVAWMKARFTIHKMVASPAVIVIGADQLCFYSFSWKDFWAATPQYFSP